MAEYFSREFSVRIVHLLLTKPTILPFPSQWLVPVVGNWLKEAL